MSRRVSPLVDERGQATFSVVAAIVVVLLGGVLVWRVADTAESIEDKASTIAKTAVPINRATDAVTNVPETNRLAGEILQSAKPLEGVLTEIRDVAKSVDRHAISINGTAGTIDGTAKSINAEAVRIIAIARSIDRGVAQINANLDVTIASAIAAEVDTTNILAQADAAHGTGACIDAKLVAGADPGIPGPNNDGHCK